MLVAVLDVGSNTVRLLVASVERGSVETVDDERAFVGLGAELARHDRLRPEKIDEAAETAARFTWVARRTGAERLETLVTAPGRQSASAPGLLAALREATGARVRVLTAAEEGELAFEGAVARATKLPPVVGVVDVGGGSTEIVVGTAAAGAAWIRSLEIGSLRLTRSCLDRDPPRAKHLDRARNTVRAALEDVRPPAPDVVFATGGSSRALGKVLGRRYGADVLDDAIPKLARRPAAKRAERFGLHPLRAETIVAGAVVLAEVGRLLERPFELARGGLREGAALRLAAVEAVAA